MPRRKRSTTPNFDSFDDDFDDDASSSTSRSNHPPIQRNAANARERARMRVLSSAFCRLKTKLPNIPPDTKLSKLDTLRLATIYIQQLKALLDGEGMDETLNFPHPQNLTWPFSFQQIPSIRQPTNFLTGDDWHHEKLTSNEIYSNQQINSFYNSGGQ